MEVFKSEKVEKIYKALEKKYKNKNINRLKHSIGVFNHATRLAHIYKQDVEQTQIAALMHDYNRYETIEEQLKIINDREIENRYRDFEFVFHAYSASETLKTKFGIADPVIINAINYHVLGNTKMDNVAKIIFVSDFCEENRVFPEAKIVNKKSLEDLDKALLLTLEYNVIYHKNKIHKDTQALFDKLRG